MGHRRWVAALMAAAVLAAGCSQRAPEESIASPGPTSSTTTPADDPDTDILYVQHALFGTTATDDTGTTLTLTGVDQVTAWTTADDGGTMPTASFIESWSDLGLDADNPQAAFIPADPDQSPVIIELSDPAWDGERRTITYRVRPIAESEERLAGMVTDPSATLPESFDVATLVISQPDAPELPDPPPTTTTTTTLPPETVPPDTGAPPETPSTSSRSTTVNPPGLTPPPPSPQPSPPPSGPAEFTFSPGSLRFSADPGTRTLVLTNVGSGVGSWSVRPEIGTGLVASPMGGYLFPGSSVTVTIQYNGQGPANDFATTMELLTSSGFFLIPVVVG